MAAIGQAGENLVRLAVVMTGFSHSAGGVGGVFGSKRLKAIAVRGTGAVRIAAARQEWKQLVQLHPVHHGRQQPARRAEHAAALGGVLGPGQPLDRAERAVLGRRAARRSRPASAGRRTSTAWGIAPPRRPTTSGRTPRSTRSGWAAASSCPIRCHSHLDVPVGRGEVRRQPVRRQHLRRLGRPQFLQSRSRTARAASPASKPRCVGKHLADDLGIWTNYSQLQRDFRAPTTTG